LILTLPIIRVKIERIKRVKKVKRTKLVAMKTVHVLFREYVW
jgi:hypothetical protein